jgi:NhaB family Na+:H+ antiporter
MSEHGSPWPRLFLGGAPRGYKLAVALALALNPLLYGLLHLLAPAAAGGLVGWLITGEFIVTLAMALHCYPLLPGGLLALEAVVMGLAPVDEVYREAERNFPVILLLIFVVAGVSFLREWLDAVFSAILSGVRSKVALSTLFCAAGALLSAFLDALTVMAVIIAVCAGFSRLYLDWRSETGGRDEAELAQVRAFLRSLVMHAGAGTALGGVATLIGEPQNLLIANQVATHAVAVSARWDFGGFFMRMAPVAVPTFIAGLLVAAVCERCSWFGFGGRLPETVRVALAERARQRAAGRTALDRARQRVQALCALLLAVGLACHWAEVGILGLFLIVVVTAFTGVSDERRIGHAFTESLPFTALLVVFFAIVAMIGTQQLFAPIGRAALAQGPAGQLFGFYAASAVLSTVSDNVFVATVFINQATAAFAEHVVGVEQYEKLAIAINAGTNLPSVATPNGQAALLFLLTSSLAPEIRLGYGRMCWMALPYTLVLTGVSLVCVMAFV